MTQIQPAEKIKSDDIIDLLSMPRNDLDSVAIDSTDLGHRITARPDGFNKLTRTVN